MGEAGIRNDITLSRINVTSQFIHVFYKILAESLTDPTLSVEKKFWKKKFEFFLPKTPPGHPWVSTKNFSPIGPAVWPAIGNECLVLLYRYMYFVYMFFNKPIGKEISLKSTQFGCKLNKGVQKLNQTLNLPTF